jgi:outer membrane protein OmpA-like peptidoglycan-associated protein
MKHLYVAFIILMLFVRTELNAQYGDFKQGLLIRKTFYDYNTIRNKDAAAVIDFQNGFEIAYLRNLSQNISVIVPFGAGIFKQKDNDALKTAFYSVGLQGQLHLFKTNRWANPFFTSGIQAVFPKGKDLALELPLGLGIQFMVHPQVYLHWQSDYRLSISNWEDHLQHHLGFVYLFGNIKNKKDTTASAVKPDSDKDGIIDELDLCPNTPGLAKFAGCPDTDGDGVEDAKDKCPEIKGKIEFNGCPDTDEDGVADNEDQCPNIKGTAANKGCPDADTDGDGVADKDDRCPDKSGTKEMSGCPDSDGDGISDADDKCPNVPGLKSNSGCPEPTKKDSDNDGITDDKDECPFTAGLATMNGCPDTDGDGVMDKIDNCPTAPGPASNKGCPVIEKADRETLDFAMRAVQFDLGRATLKAESFNILDKVAKIMKKYPDYNLSIGGHTDNTGSAKFNLDLSERRAKVCYEYLISQGVPVSKLSYAGYGASKPISSNSNETGRFLNRRVEFNLVPR